MQEFDRSSQNEIDKVQKREERIGQSCAGLSEQDGYRAYSKKLRSEIEDILRQLKGATLETVVAKPRRKDLTPSERLAKKERLAEKKRLSQRPPLAQSLTEKTRENGMSRKQKSVLNDKDSKLLQSLTVSGVSAPKRQVSFMARLGKLAKKIILRDKYMSNCKGYRNHIYRDTVKRLHAEFLEQVNRSGLKFKAKFVPHSISKYEKAYHSEAKSKRNCGEWKFKSFERFVKINAKYFDPSPLTAAQVKSRSEKLLGYCESGHSTIYDCECIQREYFSRRTPYKDTKNIVSVLEGLLEMPTCLNVAGMRKKYSKGCERYVKLRQEKGLDTKPGYCNCVSNKWIEKYTLRPNPRAESVIYKWAKRACE
ncbi:MAG TPA: hypothetical protein EYQ81_15685 [Sneathiellales bacterium]|nr:hypothetical protein [Sneathiellales bacterium]